MYEKFFFMFVSKEINYLFHIKKYLKYLKYKSLVSSSNCLTYPFEQCAYSQVCKKNI